MNPVFLMVKDMPQVKAAIQQQKLRAVQEANKKVAEWLLVIEQNIGYCEESPTMAELGKVDALSAAMELEKAAKVVVDLARQLQ